MVKYYTPQVTKLPSGKFQYSQRYSDIRLQGVRKASVTMLKDTKQSRMKADRIVKDKIQQKLQLIGLVQSDITVSDLAAKFLIDYKKRGMAYNTVKNCEIQVNKFVRTFGNQRINSLTSVQLNRYFNNLLYEENYENASVRANKSDVTMILKYAKQMGYIKENPLDDVEINFKDDSKKKYDRIQNHYLTDDEMQLVLDDCLKRTSRLIYRDIVLWLYLTGMRIGEALALKCKDVSYNKSSGIWYADVNGTLVKGEKQPFAKTVSSMRQVALPDQAVEIYKKHNTRKNNFLFLNKNGRHVAIDAIDRYLANFSKSPIRKHPDKKLSSHIFRHTHISKLAEEGYSLEMISSRVGHSDSEITRKIYTHITKKSRESFDKQMKSFSFVPDVSQRD